MSSKVKQVADVVKRDINKWLAPIRQFLMLRDFTSNQRHEFEMAKRTQPPPTLPGGFAHKLSQNYYYDRDARRQVEQPQILYSTSINYKLLANSLSTPQITAGPGTTQQQTSFVSIKEAEKQTATLLTTEKNKNQTTQHRTPGKIYNWDG